MITENIYKELLSFRDNAVRRPEGPTPMIRYLEKEVYIKAVDFDVYPGLSLRPVMWEITIPGLSVLSEFEAERRKEAETKRQQRFQNQISVAQVLVPFVTFVLGLVVEHYAGLVSGLAELLGRWVK